MFEDVPRILGFLGRCPRRPWLIFNEHALRSGLGFLRKTFKIKEKREQSGTWKVKTCFVTKSVRFGRTELFFFLESSPRDLGIGHCFEACSFQNKRKHLNFPTC